MNLSKGIEALFTRADQTEARYHKALEEKEEQLIQLQGQLQEKQFTLKELHKETILGTISKATFEEEAEKVTVLQKQAEELQKEINLIQVYQTEDIKAVIEELDAEKRKVAEKHQGEIKTLKLELLQAKEEYLKKMVEAREKYNQLVAPERKLDTLKIRVGLKQTSYISDSFDTLFQYSIASGGYETVRIEQAEVYQALQHGRIPEKLTKIVNDAKEKGII